VIEILAKLKQCNANIVNIVNANVNSVNWPLVKFALLISFLPFPYETHFHKNCNVKAADKL